ncbi:MAG: ATP-binding protein [Pyrinomonadaceae bacterium]
MSLEYAAEEEPVAGRADEAGSYAESIVETVRQPLIVLDQELRVKTANRAFYQTFKVTAAGTENTSLFELGSGQWNIPALRCLLEEILPQNAQIEEYEVEHEFPLIGRRTMLLNARSLRDENLTPRLILLAIEDVTERRRAEEALKIFSAKLERSNRELQDFASVASHDLQEPLRKIQAFGDRLKGVCGDALGEQGRDYLERMQAAALRMQTLINDLLTFSRVESQARPFTTVDLGVITREVLSDLEVQVERKEAVVEVGELPVIEADPLQMRQLMQNLINNSLKYRREGVPPVIKIRGEVLPDRRRPPSAGQAQAGKLCRINVEDNGIGFDEKYLDRIFVVFQRLHGRMEYEGTGVGLAVCRKIVERHEGQITARSEPGQGATFIVTLPVRQPNGETRL